MKKKPEDMTITDWSVALHEFQKLDGYRPEAAIRIENTLFTSARYFGGMTYNGAKYTYFEPEIPGEKNEDGSQTVAWLMVREDFLRWVSKGKKK